MRCAQCKFWKEYESWESGDCGMRMCVAVRERWKIQDEASPKAHDEEYTKVRSDALRTARAYVEDGSEYKAALVTGPDFFCALFVTSED